MVFEYHSTYGMCVKNGRPTLLGVVDNEADKTVAGVRAREVEGVFAVENELVVNKR